MAKKESLVIEIAGKVNPSLAKAIKDAQGKIDKIANSPGGKAVSLLGKGLGTGLAVSAKVGAAAVAATSTALLGAGAAAIKAGAEYESAFRDVQKTVNAPEGQNAEQFYENLSDSIRQMAKEMPQSAAEIAEVTAAAGQLGIQAQNLSEFTKAMVMMGDATNLSSDEASTALAKFANITGMDQTKFTNLGSSIVALGNNMATTEADIVGMATRLAAAGSQVGMSESQIMGFAAALSSVGMNAEAGGSAFSRAMVNMQLATETGGESLQQFASVAGMSSAEFKQAFQDDAAGAIAAFVQGLAASEERGTSAIKVLDDMGITEITLRDSLLRAAGAADLFDKAQQISNEAFEEGNALANEATQRYTTLQSRLSILKNRVTDLGIEFYQTSTGPISDAVQFATDQIDLMANTYETGGLAGLANSVGQVGANTVMAIVSAAPQAISAAGTVISSFVSGLQANWPQITAAASTGIAALAQGFLAGAPQLMQTGWSMVIQLVHGIVSSGSVATIAQGAVEAIGGFITAIISNFPQILELGGQILWQLVTGILQGIANAAGQIWSAIKGIFTGDGGDATAAAEAAEAGKAQGDAYAQSVAQSLEANQGTIAAPTTITVDTTAAEAAGAQYGAAMAQGVNSSALEVETATAGLQESLAAAQTMSTNAIDTAKISEQATTAQTSVNTAVTQMKTLWTQAVNDATEAAQKIKSAFENMTITVPRPKLPKINVSYSLAGTGGATVNVPNFSVEYFAEGGILNRPTLFGGSGNTGYIGGENGPEAVTPLAELWRQLREFAKEITGGQGGFTYAPVFNLGPGVDRRDVEAANRMGLKEFERLYKQMMDSQRRKNL